MNTYQELKLKVFKSGSNTNLFIGINVIVFLILSGIQIIELLFLKNSNLYNLFYNYLAVPADLKNLLFKFWTPISYMFIHANLLHILFNMLWLFWMGKLFEQFLSTKKIAFIYFGGGIFGALLYILAYNTIPAFLPYTSFTNAVGASAAVSAIVIATATYLPNYSIQLLLFGAVKLKWIALIYIVFDLLSLAGSNAGGHITHLGGALFGFLFIKSLQKGKDWSLPIENLFKPKKKLKVVSNNYEIYNRNSNLRPNQDTIDEILDKISAFGYDRLTKKEKEILFRASKDNEEEKQ